MSMEKFVFGSVNSIVTLPVFEVFDPETFVNFNGKPILAVVRYNEESLLAYKLFDRFVLKYKTFTCRMIETLRKKGHERIAERKRNDKEAIEIAKAEIRRIYEKLKEQGAIDGTLDNEIELVYVDE